mmetsp:Transcript_8934/g.19984  ORF Transcript_8934/g.19984 Transcript_8934/m.19984 type:complete len:222 (+) Transcript_8934:69-734(+)|eukprot:CAMPEP_0178401266 /NCGR_PEP_ID=MMETSP0689_2-20121128/16212_1 /TAXON_ID=160604 /ORGANISM="Amphidinium massartii, Strain CS-259" /LENGTH=221 /DNA_ID=CAMNT_0020022079 /DNA_START=60 /DNA_END=725 /DNA_ORIENTATION=+
MGMLRALTIFLAMAGASSKLLIQKQAPNFSLPAAMPDGSTKTLSLTDYRGKYVILFFYPFDFTFVCPTEILAFNAIAEELRAKGAEVLAASTDSVHSHLAYRRLSPAEGGIGPVNYPILSDFNKEAATAYDVLADDGSAHRATFLIDKSGIVHHQLINNEPLGRNVEEAIRMLDALQHFEANGQVCQAGFKKGQKSLGAANAALEDRFKDVSSWLGEHYGK